MNTKLILVLDNSIGNLVIKHENVGTKLEGTVDVLTNFVQFTNFHFSSYLKMVVMSVCSFSSPKLNSWLKKCNLMINLITVLSRLSSKTVKVLFKNTEKQNKTKKYTILLYLAVDNIV